MEKSAPTKNAPLGIFVSYHLPRGNRARVSLDFDHVWVGPDLYQIWCFIQTFHYGCAYTPHYSYFVLKTYFLRKTHLVLH